MDNKITATGANRIYFIVIILNFIFSLILGAVDLYYDNFLDRNKYFALAVNQFIFILLPVLFYLIANNISIKETLRLNRIGFLPAILITFASLPAYIGAVALSSVVVYALQSIGYTRTNFIPVPLSSGEMLIQILVVGVSPAICEEILHRGVLLKAYENRGHAKAVIITSLLFGVFHYDITNIVAPVFLGLLIGYYVVRTDSIFAGMLAHFLNNLISVLLQYYYSKIEYVPGDSSITASQMEALLIVGGVCIIIVLTMLACFHIVTRGRYYIKTPKTTVISDIKYVLSHWPIAASIIIYVLIAVFNIMNC